MLKKVLILGAGYAGIEAALTLQKKKKKSDSIEITVIDRHSYHTLLTELHEVAGNRISEDGVIVPLREIFKYTDVRIIKGEVHDIDFENNKVLFESKEFNYDYLIFALGSEPNFYGIPGMQENAFTLWSLEDSIKIREHIKDCFIKASQEKDSEIKKSLLTFVIGGGGFTGVEMIGELAHWVKPLGREYSIKRDEVNLILVEALPTILSNLREKNVRKAMNYLQNGLNIKVLTNKAIINVTSGSVELKDDTLIKTNTLIWTAGVRASCISDAMKWHKSKTCRVIVNKYTQTEYHNVYAVGDASAFTGEKGILPALVEIALQTGKAAARNILADIRGHEKEELKPRLHGVMVSIGSTFAVSDIMSLQLPRLLSILMKHFVNIHYLFGIGGLELVSRYIKHEFFHKKHDKFLLEKHYSVTTPTFWLVPIRLFLGYSWLVEGWRKIREGWLIDPLLAGLPTEIGSGASVTASGEKIFRIVSNHTPSWYAWIADNIIIPNALLFQILIVLAEIGLGLAFISGTFTFLSGIVSILLNINFALSTGLYDYNWWYIPASLCMLGGVGRAFGVDYYLMPYLMRQWRYFVRNRRIRLMLFSD